MKHDLDYMLQVMQAAKEGKEIEVYEDGRWNKCLSPIWGWSYCDYRIKPEPPKPEYVPYENEKEYLQAAKEHGPYLKVQYYWTVPLVSATEENTIELVPSRTEIRFDKLLDCIWQDGTPCGKLKV